MCNVCDLGMFGRHLYCTALCCTEDIPTYEQIQDTNDRAERNSFVSRGVSVYLFQSAL